MSIDTTGLLEELRGAVHREAAHARRRRRLAAIAVASTALLLAGVGIAGTFDDWWTGADPVVQPAQVQSAMNENAGVIDIDLSKKATVARTSDAALVAVATKRGGFCMTLFVDVKTMLGSSCDSTPVKDDGAGSAFRSRADDTHWVGYGRVTDAGAAALDMSGAGLPARVALDRGGFFLFDIPRSQWTSLNGRMGDVAVLDASGKTLRETCVFVGIAPGSPYSGSGAMGDRPGSCANLAPIISKPQLDKATRLVSVTLAHDHSTMKTGQTVSFWNAPNLGGGTCWFVVLGAGGPTDGRAAMCGRGASNAQDRPSMSIGDGIATGWVPAGSSIVRITINGRAATFANGAFIAEVGDGPWRIVGYDGAGRAVSSFSLPG